MEMFFWTSFQFVRNIGKLKCGFFSFCGLLAQLVNDLMNPTGDVLFECYQHENVMFSVPIHLMQR